MAFSTRLMHAWNAFKNRDPTNNFAPSTGRETYSKPDRIRLRGGNEQSIITAIINRIALDVAAVKIEHVQLDEQGRFEDTKKSGLNNCLTLEANRDQTARALIQDLVVSAMDEGCVAVVPTHTSSTPIDSNAYDVEEIRCGKIIGWRPKEVKVRLYNEDKGEYEELLLPKSMVAIIENPLYAVMNEQNSTVQRLVRKLNLLDAIDEQSGSGKLDLIIQLPYAIKTESRMKQAEARRQALEQQLAGSKYGIAYADATEHITQLNRAVENNLLTQIEYLTEMVYSQLGITKEIMNGTAKEEEMLNYNNRTIEPWLSAICDEFKRKWLSKTARSQGQDIMYINDPFKLVPVSQIAEISDKFTRNEILSSNEVRQIIGLKPVDDVKADELRNKNLNVGDGQAFATTDGEQVIEAPVNPETGQPQGGEELQEPVTEEDATLMESNQAAELSPEQEEVLSQIAEAGGGQEEPVVEEGEAPLEERDLVQELIEKKRRGEIS